MFYLFLSIIASAFIGNLIYLYQKDKKLQILQVFLGNYFLASIFSYISNTTNFSDVRFLDILLGCITGFLFLANFIVYQKNIKVNGLSLSVGVMRISLIIPTLLSIAVFSENILLINYFGIIIILFSFTFRTETRNFHNFFWILFLFFITGITDSMLKIYDTIGLPQDGAFVFFLFGSAFIFNLIWIGIQKRKIILKYFLWGMLLGIPNQLTTRFFLDSLQSVKAAIAYPLLASSVVVITILCDIFIWKKRFNVKQRFAFALLVVGIILLNVRL